MQFEQVLEVEAGDGNILTCLNQAHFAPNLYALEISESGWEKLKRKILQICKTPNFLTATIFLIPIIFLI